MSSLNFKQKTFPQKTANAVGTVVNKIDVHQELARTVLASMLFENQFYMSGKDHYQVLRELVAKCDASFVAKLAQTARTKFKLRHVPLALMRELARKSALKANDLAAVIKRPDELGEFVSLYWKDKKQPLSAQVKKGLATALNSFNEFQLAKWDKNSAAVRIRDVMFLTHAKPATSEQEVLFKKLADDMLETPDTWETQLSAGADKGETFTRLMAENKLGALAFLRNLRNMVQSGVDEDAIRAYAETVNVQNVLPFRYVAAARVVPQFEDMLEKMMLKSLENVEKLPGKTLLLVDVSGSMFGVPVSQKSDLDRFDAAAALAMLCKGKCENVDVYSFSDKAVRVAPRSGFALREAIHNSQSHAGTQLGRALNSIKTGGYDRIIIITDEQSYDVVRKPAHIKNGYILNVGSYQNGVNSGEFTTITGFSEATLEYILELERFDLSFAA